MEAGLDEEDLPTLCRAVRASLEQEGFAYIRRPCSPEDFRLIAGSLGPVKREVGIELQENAVRAVFKPAAMQLHTDDPAIAFIGWHCIRQDRIDGASLILDSQPLLAAFSEEELARLGQVRVRCPRPDTAGFIEYPLVEPSARGPRIYYAPWMLVPPVEPGAAALLRRFAGTVEEAGRSARVRIRMIPGEALFIDNRRVLHGRDALAPDSPRLLHRVWVGAS